MAENKSEDFTTYQHQWKK